jgi:hypothetical protein
MITFKRTRDLDAVASILTHEKLWPWIADDFYPAPENFRPNDAECIWYLLAFDEEDTPLGLFITHPINQLLWEVDHALLPWAWGRTRAIGAAFEAWLWENTPATKAIGFTPSCNKLALRYARKAGMCEVGRIARCYQRQFELHDIVIFEKEKFQSPSQRGNAPPAPESVAASEVADKF